MDMPQSAQEYLVLYSVSAPSASTITTPSASLSALSTESDRRFSTPSFIFILSTTTLMVWRTCLSRFISSSRSRISPSILTRT